MSPPPETRLAPVPFAEWDDHTRDVLLPHLRRPELYLSGAPDAPPMPVVMELFAHHLPLSETWLAFSNMLASDQSTLDPRLRELLIVRVAWRTQSGYEWGQHARMGRDAGLTDAQLRAVAEGPAAAVWTPLERALVMAVDEIVDGFGVGDETWNTLSSSLEPAQLFELLFVIGGYLCMAGVLNSIGLRGDPPGGTVKAVRSQDGGVALVDVDEPPGIGEVLDMKAASVCASDFSYIRYGSTSILGHELAGLREDGTPVVVEAIYGCLECDQCRRGAYNLCPTHGSRALGMFADGGMAEQFRAPPERLVPLPTGLELRDASVVEPASVSWHALRLAETGPGRRVVVVGAGALGLLAVAGARAQGGEDVALEARHPHQREAGERLGARVGAEESYDVVVEAAGSPESLARCAELVAPGGTIVVLGVHFGPVQLDWMPLFNREARLIPSLGYCEHDGVREMEEAAAMLAGDPDIVRTVITHRFPLEDAAEAFRVGSDRGSGAIRVVLEPS